MPTYNAVTFDTFVSKLIIKNYSANKVLLYETCKCVIRPCTLDIQCCDVTFCGLRRMPSGSDSHRASPSKVFARLLHNYNSQEPPMKGITSVADRRTVVCMTQTQTYHCVRVLSCSFCVSLFRCDVQITHYRP